ncbi:mitochondrial carrier domain-containing protein [Globomyces pollinis-pini]|nr:mitochondrial carrier domain-containing protein [Globomyces pollinis-pini]
MIAGGIGGSSADAFLHSLDTLKTRMQGQLTTHSNKYNGILNSFQLIAKEEGFRGFFGGFNAAVLGSIVSTTTYFGIYEILKRELIECDINPSIGYFISGGVADLAASIFYVPSEVIKTRLQLQGKYNNPHSLSAHNYKNTYHAFQQIYQKRGLFGLYYGWSATLLRDVPFSAIQFTIYETMKSFFLRHSNQNNQSELTIFHDCLSGGTAGAIAGGITTPLDVIKTYLQTQKRSVPRGTFLDTKGDISIPAPKATGVSYSGIYSALRGIRKTSGIKGLFSGIGVRMFWTGSQSMIMFMVYEALINQQKQTRVI